ncbi:MAG TPA: hypothetical protein VL068_09000, partial [Microthrixaceae bacterium]|nr:hypothetical protein [Microthrixaceae bacterium]
SILVCKGSLIGIQVWTGVLSLGAPLLATFFGTAIIRNEGLAVWLGIGVFVWQLLACLRVKVWTDGHSIIVVNRIRTHRFGRGSKVIFRDYRFSTNGASMLHIVAPGRRPVPILASARLWGESEVDLMNALERILRRL